MVKVTKLHEWSIDYSRARRIQSDLAGKVSRKNEVKSPHFIAGVDLAINKQKRIGNGAVVVLSYPELKIVEAKITCGELDFPYIPGLLSFRESPLILEACRKLTVNPELILVDGQGIAHPRRFGLASHLGILLDLPTIGCAKSLLCGSAIMPDNIVGHQTNIVDRNDIIGVTVRTKLNVKPLYVSIGHKVDLITASHWVLNLCRGFRLPEPIRFAHRAAGGKYSNT
jgi:deoxyribonuclease V